MRKALCSACTSSFVNPRRSSPTLFTPNVFAPRSVIRAADPVLYLVPQDRPLVIAAQIEAKTCQKRVGLTLTGAPAREGAEIASKDGTVIGIVTSGGFGPTVNGPVAMGYIDRDFMQPGTEVDILVRGKPRAAKVAKMPFVTANFYRG